MRRGVRGREGQGGARVGGRGAWCACLLLFACPARRSARRALEATQEADVALAMAARLESVPLGPRGAQGAPTQRGWRCRSRLPFFCADWLTAAFALALAPSLAARGHACDFVTGPASACRGSAASARVPSLEAALREAEASSERCSAELVAANAALLEATERAEEAERSLMEARRAAEQTEAEASGANSLLRAERERAAREVRVAEERATEAEAEQLRAEHECHMLKEEVAQMGAERGGGGDEAQGAGEREARAAVEARAAESAELARRLEAELREARAEVQREREEAQRARDRAREVLEVAHAGQASGAGVDAAQELAEQQRRHDGEAAALRGEVARLQAALRASEAAGTSGATGMPVLDQGASGDATEVPPEGLDRPTDVPSASAGQAAEEAAVAAAAVRDRLLAEVDAQSEEIERLHTENVSLMEHLEERAEVAAAWEGQVRSCVAQIDALKNMLAEQAATAAEQAARATADPSGPSYVGDGEGAADAQPDSNGGAAKAAAAVAEVARATAALEAERAARAAAEAALATARVERARAAAAASEMSFAYAPMLRDLDAKLAKVAVPV